MNKTTAALLILAQFFGFCAGLSCQSADPTDALLSMSYKDAKQKDSVDVILDVAQEDCVVECVTKKLVDAGAPDVSISPNAWESLLNGDMCVDPATLVIIMSPSY